MKRFNSSRLTTWIIRILCFFILLICACLVMLSAMGGTSDAHKKGLEQAFSDALKAKITIGTLEEFNIIPQLLVSAGDIRGVFPNSADEFLVDKLHLAFGFTDLISGKRKIEDFQVDNFHFTAQSKYDLRVEHAGFTTTPSPEFGIKGQYSGENFDAVIPVVKDENGRTSYSFNEDNIVSGHYGHLTIKGKISSKEAGTKQLEDVTIHAEDKIIATGYSQGSGKNFVAHIDCKQDMPPSAKADLKNLTQIPFVKPEGNCPK